MTVRVRLLVALSCLVASVGYLGAVTPRALLVYVLPASLIGSLAAASGRASRLGSALIATLVAGVTWSVIVNVLSGQTEGPAARSSAFAAALSGLAVVAVQTRLPSSFLLPVVGVLAGALALGAGGEVAPVAVAAVVPAVLALRAVDAESRCWLLPPRDRVVTAAGLLLALLGGVAVLQLPIGSTPLVLFPAQANPLVSAGLPDLVARPLERDRPRPTAAATDPTFRPQPTSRASVAATRPTVTATPPIQPPVSHRRPASHRLRLVLLAVGALSLLLVLAVFLRLLLVRLAWRRLRRSYDCGDARSRTVGAWLWVCARLEGLRMALPPGLSPDAFDAASPPKGVPAVAVPALAELAPLSARAGFSPASPSDGERALAWQHAGRALARAEHDAPRRSRVRIRLSGPGAK